MMRGAATVLCGTAATSVLSLARNLIVARLIPLEDYGIAATLIVVLAVVEMASALGLQQQIVRDGQGDDPRHQAALQGLHVLRGAVLAVVLFVLAEPLALFFGVESAATSYRWLALVPLLNGLAHFDMHRLHRHLRFGPMLLANLIPAGMSVALVWPSALWLGDHRALLWAILAQSAGQVLASHLMAERPYRLALRYAAMRESLRFGWPILLNGALLFAVFNGDRLIIGHLAGMEPLALFSMGLTLALAPALVLEKSAQVYFLPLLATALSDAARFARLSAVAFRAHLAAGALLVAGVALLGPPFARWALDGRYAGLEAILPLLAVQQGLRLVKNGNSPAALAQGRTVVSLLVGLPRLFCLGLAVIVVRNGGGLDGVILTGIVGEGLGFALSLFLTRRMLHLPLRPLVPASVLFVCVVVVAGWGAVLGPAAAAALMAALCLATLVLTPEMTPLRARRAA